jgi:hypothetical protein
LVIFKIRERADRIRRTREKLRRISPILMWMQLIGIFLFIVKWFILTNLWDCQHETLRPA